jgi:hypothetical protein
VVARLAGLGRVQEQVPVPAVHRHVAAAMG